MEEDKVPEVSPTETEAGQETRQMAILVKEASLRRIESVVGTTEKRVGVLATLDRAGNWYYETFVRPYEKSRFLQAGAVVALTLAGTYLLSENQQAISQALEGVGPYATELGKWGQEIVNNNLQELPSWEEIYNSLSDVSQSVPFAPEVLDYLQANAPEWIASANNVLETISKEAVQIYEGSEPARAQLVEGMNDYLEKGSEFLAQTQETASQAWNLARQHLQNFLADLGIPKTEEQYEKFLPIPPTREA